MSDEVKNGINFYALKATYKEKDKFKEIFFDFTPFFDEAKMFFFRHKNDEEVARARDTKNPLKKNDADLSYPFAFPLYSLEIVKYPKTIFENEYNQKSYFKWCLEAEKNHEKYLTNNLISTDKSFIFNSNTNTNKNEGLVME